MERYTILLPPEDTIRPTNKLGTYGRCIRWNFVDDWVPFNQGIGLPPQRRELWLPENIDHTTAMKFLLNEAKRERERLLQSLSGLAQGINIDEGGERTASANYEEQQAMKRKQSLLIAQGDTLPEWRGRQ